MKFTDSMHKCTVHIGLGQDDSDYIDLSQQRDIMKELLFLAFRKAGFANQTLGENKLLPCSMGTFVNSSADDPSDMKCLECPAGGFYTDTKAYVNDSCQRCANGTFVHYNNAPGKSQFDCKACPQGTNTSEFAGFRACKCLNGFSRTHMFEGCTPCDPQGGLKCLNDYATLKSGYWWQWRNETHRELYKNFTINLNNSFYSPTLHANSSVANNSLIEYPHTLPRPYRCPMQNACKGGLDSQLCHDGYKGPLCDVCSDKYYKQLNACKECPTNAWMAGQLSILAVVIVLFIIVVVWKSKTKSKKSTGRSFMDILLGRTKIVIGFYQVTNGVLEAFSYIKWPNSLALIGQYSAIIQLNILQITPVHCVISALKADAFTSLFAIMGFNGTAVILAFASYGLIKLVSLRNNLNEEEKLKKTAHAKQVISRNLFFFLYVTYLSTCFKTAQVLPLACRELCVDENDNICDKFLKADYNIKCTGTRYTRLVIVAYFAVLYVILLPTVSLIVIWRQRRVIRATEKETGNEETNVEDQTTGVFTGLRFLYDNYNPDAWFWELVETARKVILTSGLILIGGESRAYIGLACVISGLYGIYFAYKKPIIDRFENGLMVTSLSVTFVNLVIGAVSSIPEEGISSTIDPYVDDVMFNILVFGVNSVVIGLLVVQYLLYVYRYMKEWRKNPQWSLSCCLALILPLNDLQGELRGMTGRNVLKQQLNTGRIDMPSMGRALKDSGAIDFGLEDDPSSLTADSEHPEETTHTKRSDLEEGVLTIAEVCIHQMPRGTYDTKL